MSASVSSRGSVLTTTTSIVSEATLTATLAGLDASLLGLAEGRARFAAFRAQVTQALGELNDAKTEDETGVRRGVVVPRAALSAISLSDLGEGVECTGDGEGGEGTCRSEASYTCRSDNSVATDSFLAAAASQRCRAGSDAAVARLRRLADGGGSATAIVNTSSSSSSSPLARARNDLDSMLRTLDAVRAHNGVFVAAARADAVAVADEAKADADARDAAKAAAVRHGGSMMSLNLTAAPSLGRRTAALSLPPPPPMGGVEFQSTREHAMDLLSASLSNVAALHRQTSLLPPAPTLNNNTPMRQQLLLPLPPPPASPPLPTLQYTANIAEDVSRAAAADARARAATAEATLALLTSRITHLRIGTANAAAVAVATSSSSSSARQREHERQVATPQTPTPSARARLPALVSDDLFASQMRRVPPRSPDRGAQGVVLERQAFDGERSVVLKREAFHGSPLRSPVASLPLPLPLPAARHPVTPSFKATLREYPTRSPLIRSPIMGIGAAETVALETTRILLRARATPITRSAEDEKSMSYARETETSPSSCKWEGGGGGVNFTERPFLWRWAGCRRTRKSTTGGVAMRGTHCLKTWSVTQSR